jgi:hypothetical protein
MNASPAVLDDDRLPPPPLLLRFATAPFDFALPPLLAVAFFAMSFSWTLEGSTPARTAVSRSPRIAVNRFTVLTL